MYCQIVRKRLIDFLDAGSSTVLPNELTAHLQSCPDCARYYDEAKRTLAALQPQQTVRTSNDFKERVMSQIYQHHTLEQQHRFSILRERGWMGWVLKPVTVMAMVGLLLAAFWISDLLVSKQNPSPIGSGLSALSLLSDAWASEQALFEGEGVVHLVNQILVPAIQDEALAQGRWFPLYSLDASGKPRIHQLTLATAAGKGYSVLDEVWYDPSQKRYIRQVRLGDRTIFAVAFDGSQLYAPETGADGKIAIVGKAVTADFHPPESPIDFLGIYPGFASLLDEKNQNQVELLEDARLEDGTEVRVLKAVAPQPENAPENGILFKINKSNNTLAEVEWRMQGASFMVIRRLKSEIVDASKLSWNLDGVVISSESPDGQPQPGIRSDMVVPNVSVRHMIEKADFETYVFATMPSWTSERQIVDVLDVASPPKRMFFLVYKASDQRNVILIQSPTYNQAMSQAAKSGTLLYQSPNGFKVWSTPMDKMGATIALQSTQSFTQTEPVEDRTGHILESPAGTYPALAVNGALSDDELHALIDSLVPAKEYKE